MKLIAALILIYSSQVALAGGESDLYDGGVSASREITSVLDTLPDQEDLDQAPRCEGNPRVSNTCSEFRTLDLCLELGSDQGCFWAYY